VKILVAVMGCEAHAADGTQQASRSTWVQDVAELGDCRFFIGHGSRPLLADEVRVNAPDTKDAILYKTVELLRWALDHGYDMILKVDTDTYVNVRAILRENYSGIDYVGALVGRIGELYGDTTLWAFLQGSAQWLSARAARVIIDEVIPNMLRLLPETLKFSGVISPHPHSEDLWIGQVLIPRVNNNQLRALPDDRYANGPLTFHHALDKTKFSVSEWMRRLHEARPFDSRMMAVHEARASWQVR
jgi:hypothetical protein